MNDIDRITDILSHHWWESRGMSWNSADGCSCGAHTLPQPGDADISERRALAFAKHQAEMLAGDRWGYGSY